MSVKTLVPKLQLAHKSDAHIAEFASQRINSLTENAVAFPGLSPTVIEVTAAYENFVSAMEACGTSGNRTNTMAKNDMREILCNNLTWVAQSCIEIANGDATLFGLSGFDLKAKAQRITSIDCPANIKVTPGPFDGSVYCSFKLVEHARCYEIQYGNNQADMETWSSLITSSSRKNMLTDLTPMSYGYMRIRTIGPRTISSEWSTVIQFKVV